MNKHLYNIAEAVVTIIASIILMVRHLWTQFHVRFLKKVCMIETPTYKKWWKRHSQKLQRMLDKEHQTTQINAANFG